MQEHPKQLSILILGAGFGGIYTAKYLRKGVTNLVGKFELKGFTVWFSWKLTYLRHLLIIEKLTHVLWDWSFDLLYNRQIARFKLH